MEIQQRATNRAKFGEGIVEMSKDESVRFSSFESLKVLTLSVWDRRLQSAKRPLQIWFAQGRTNSFLATIPLIGTLLKISLLLNLSEFCELNQCLAKIRTKW